MGSAEAGMLWRHSRAGDACAADTAAAPSGRLHSAQVSWPVSQTSSCTALPTKAHRGLPVG
jgi:hypothetical protein